MRVNKAERQIIYAVWRQVEPWTQWRAKVPSTATPRPRRALGGGLRGGDSGRSPAIAFLTPASALARGSGAGGGIPDRIAEFCQIRKKIYI